MRKIVSLLLVVVAVSNIFSQDVHFSQYNAQPLLLNPAITGLSGCDYRVGGNFRTQWFGVSQGNTYRTTSAFGDVVLGKPSRYSNYAGLGVSFLSDQAGDLNFNTNKVDISLAYHIMINKNKMQSVSIGLQGGFGHRNLDQSRALFAFDPITGEPVEAARETFDGAPVLYGDAGVGFLYSIKPKKNSNYYFGVGLQHLNQPNLSVFAQNRDESERLYAKFTFHGGSEIPINDQVSLMPGFMILKQGPHSQFLISNYFKFKTSATSKSAPAFYFGTMYRVLDAFILATRADFKGMSINFSYDLNLSKLTTATNANGGPEIALIYTGCYNRKVNTRYCPSF